MTHILNGSEYFNDCFKMFVFIWNNSHECLKENMVISGRHSVYLLYYCLLKKLIIRKCIHIATMKISSMKSYFTDMPSFKEAIFIKHGFCQYHAPFPFPNLWKKQAHLMAFENTGVWDG